MAAGSLAESQARQVVGSTAEAEGQRASKEQAGTSMNLGAILEFPRFRAEVRGELPLMLVQA